MMDRRPPSDTVQGPWGALGLLSFVETLRATRCALVQFEYVAERRCTSEGFSGHRIRTALWEGIQALDEPRGDPQMAFLVRKTQRLLPEKPPEVRSGVNAWPYVLGVEPGSIDLPPGGTLNIALLLFGEAAETWPVWALGGRQLTLGSRSLHLQSVQLAGRYGAMTHWAGEPLAGEAVTLGDLCPPAPEVSNDLLAIEFLTPARKRKKLPSGEWVDDDLLDEGTLLKFVRALYPRLRAVAAADIDPVSWDGLKASAAELEVVVDETQWATVVHKGKCFRGRLGRIVCHGSMQLLLPLLTVGQLTHVGSESTWGLGRYCLLGCESQSGGADMG